MIGVGVGTAAAAAIEPLVEPGKQQAWKKAPNRVLDSGLMARLVAQGAVTPDLGREQAAREGFNQDKFDRLVYLAQRAPDLALTFEMWRRGRITEAQVDHALAKEQIEAQYWPALKELFSNRLGPAVIATAIQRGVMAAPFKLPYDPNVPVGNVTPFPVSPLDAADEAKAWGIDVERLRVETALVGLPMALDRAAQGRFRGILTEGDYLRAVLEGNARGEWADAELEVARQILTAGQYAELELRGYYDRATRLANTAKHGMSDADSDWLYDVLGRGVNVHQVLIGERRGGVFGGPYDTIPKAYLSSLQRGNLRPEFYNLAYAARETYPSYFVTRAMLQAGTITTARGRELFLGLGWPLDVAEAAAATFGTATTATADKHVTKAQTQLWTRLHSSYLADEIDEATVTATLPDAGVPAASVAEVVRVWNAERAIIRKQLTPTQLRKAYTGVVTNPATGQPWTYNEVLDALVGRGYALADAETFLAE